MSILPQPGPLNPKSERTFSRSMSEVSLWDQILPPTVIPLLLLLVLVIPIVLLTGQSLFVPLYEWFYNRLTLSAGNESALGDLPIAFFIKIIAFLILSFLGCVQLLLRIKSIYYATWARAFPRPHTLHTDYQSDSNQGMMALFQWKLYQVGLISLPPVLMAIFTGVAGLVALYLFNTFSDLSFVGLSVQLTIELFVMMMLGLFTFFAFLNSLWTALTSLFGDVIAVTEPSLPNSLISQRCNRLAFVSPYVYVLFPIYLIIIAGSLGEAIWLLSTADIQQFISFQGHVPLIFGLEALTLAVYIGFCYFKFYAYHQGLVSYYQKLPAQIKACFSSPPTR